jgi:hypothetical protein
VLSERVDEAIATCAAGSTSMEVRAVDHHHTILEVNFKLTSYMRPGGSGHCVSVSDSRFGIPIAIIVVVSLTAAASASHRRRWRWRLR